LESLVNVLSEGSELSLEETDGLGDDFLIGVSLVTALGVLDVFVITVLELLVVLDLLLLGTGVLLLLLVGGEDDSLVEGLDFGLEVTDLSVDLVELGLNSLLGGLVLGDPMLVGTSLDFTTLGDLVQELVTDVDDLLNSGGGSLDGGGGGDLGEQLED